MIDGLLKKSVDGEDLIRDSWVESEKCTSDTSSIEFLTRGVFYVRQEDSCKRANHLLP